MTHVEELLSVWRDADRLLETLPPMSPEYETLRDAVERVRAAYQIVTEDRPATDASLDAAAAALRETRQLLIEVRLERRPQEGIAAPQAEPA
jgi:hypothetical protein